MARVDRRTFLAAGGAGLGAALAPGAAAGVEAALGPGSLHLAPFRFDVTPPLGHACCGGWIKPVEAVDDPLEAIGFVLLSDGPPVVICAVDWTGLLNDAHVAFRQALAEGAGTTPDRVAVHCVHQHNAPMACTATERLVAAQGDLPHVLDLDFFARTLDAGRAAVRAAVPRAAPVTHVAAGQARVEKVAGNRRILGPDGRVRTQRGSASKVPEHHALPEGLIDPYLKTVAFYEGSRKRAALHYYACHPMSYYGDGRVTADFCGLARKRRQAEESDCVHLYFDGCGGNIGAGKYNDGSPGMRPVLTERIYQGMVAAEATLRPEPIRAVRWTTHDLLPPPDAKYDAAAIERQLADRSLPVVARNRPAYTLAWIRRHAQRIPIVLSGLHVNGVSLLHLPAEAFVEYQLRAQAAAPDRFVACAAYGDDGPWYIPTREAYPQGGYEVSMAWCGPEVDDHLTRGIRALLAGAAD